MSRIIRYDAPPETKPNIRTIEIHNFTFPSAEDVEIVEEISMETVLAEKERLLQEARTQIEQERQQFEAQCATTVQQLEQAKHEWEEQKLLLQQQAYEEGFTQGLDEGRNKAFDNMAQDLQLANDTVYQAQLNAQAYLESQEQVILALAMTSAQHIISTVVEENDERFVGIVRRALKDVRESDTVKIYVTPYYHKVLTHNREELMALFPPHMPFMIFVDDQLIDQQCYIETNHGRVVVTADEQLKELRSKLMEILQSME